MSVICISSSAKSRGGPPARVRSYLVHVVAVPVPGDGLEVDGLGLLGGHDLVLVLLGIRGTLSFASLDCSEDVDTSPLVQLADQIVLLGPRIFRIYVRVPHGEVLRKTVHHGGALHVIVDLLPELGVVVTLYLETLPGYRMGQLAVVMLLFFFGTT